MWGNLKRLGEFVAPQDGDDSSYESYYDEDIDEEDEGEYLDSEGEEQEEEEESRSPFGFVGMITKAIDSNQRQYDESHREASSSSSYSHYLEDENNKDFDEAIVFDEGNKVDVHETEKEAQETKIIAQHHEQQKETISNGHEDIQVATDTIHTAPISPSPTKEQQQSMNQSQQQQQQPTSRSRPPRADSVITQGMPFSMSPRQLMTDQRPILVREKGSVSPGNHRLSRENYVERQNSDPDKKIIDEEQQQEQQQTLKLLPSSAGNQGSNDNDIAKNKPASSNLGRLPLPFNDDEEERVDTGPTSQPILQGKTPTDTKSEVVLTEKKDQTKPPKGKSKSTLPPCHKLAEPAILPSSVAAASSDSTTAATASTAKSKDPPLALETHSSDDEMPRYATQPEATVTTHQKLEFSSTQDRQLILQLEERCKDLASQLSNAEARVFQLQQQANENMERSKSHDEELYLNFQQKEARLLQAAAEDHRQEIDALRQELEQKMQLFQEQVTAERSEEEKEQKRLKRSVEDFRRRAERAEREVEQTRMQLETELSNIQRQQQRDHNATEEKLAQTMALLDERDEQIAKLKKTVKSLQSRMSEHQEGVAEAEEEMDELHSENETLRDHLGKLENECAKLRLKVEELQSDSDQLTVVKMELRMLTEQHEREKAKVWSAAESAANNTEQLEAQRGELVAKVHDLERQLAASVADVELARADMERVMISNANLQSALEAFQNEREAELGLLDEQRAEAEVAAAAAHAAALEAANEVHEAQIRQIKLDAEHQLAEYMQKIKEHEEKNERLRSDNVQMRRSLDEAIHRLQATQDDVIDRTLMKNILLDWLSKPGAKERQQVLQVMANLLDFTEEEKDRVHIEEVSGTIGKVVHTLAAPLPPAKADVEHLQGDNVRDKWINFLLAETDE